MTIQKVWEPLNYRSLTNAIDLSLSWTIHC